MPTMKVNLEEGQRYVGPKGLGQVQKDCTDMVLNIIEGSIEIPYQEEGTHSTITFRVGEEELIELKRISKEKNISVQNLLRIGMKQSKLIVQH